MGHEACHVRNHDLPGYPKSFGFTLPPSSSPLALVVMVRVFRMKK